ncbi:MAG: hypothetical protein NVS2B12_16550 [Ktedonobacteraceae bacterium]
MIHCPGCNMPVVEKGAFCGHCGGQLPPTMPVYPPMPVQTRAFNADAAQKNGYVKPVVQWQPGVLEDIQVRRPPAQSAANLPLSLREGSKTPFPLSSRPTPAPSPASSIRNPIMAHSLRPVSGTGRNMVFLGIILTIMLVGVLAGALTLLQHKHIPSRYTETPGMGDVRSNVSFSDGQPGTTNRLSISVSGLQALPNDGSRYSAWMINEETERIAPLGILTRENAMFKLDFQNDRASILTMGNKLEITQESAQTSLPTGHVLLSARLPMMALMHIKHLLVSFSSAPNAIGLLVGLRGQTQQLYNQTHLLKNASDEVRIRCVAQSVVNLVEGRRSIQAQPLEPACVNKHITEVSDGYGLLGNDNNGYVAGIAMHASLAATQPDTTDTIRMHAQQVIGASDNLKAWFKALDQDAHSLLVNPAATDRIQDMTALSTQALNGVDANHDGHIDFAKDEAGANSAYQAGQDMANLTLLPSL